ncbi:MAG: alkyl hydroperoxide reductase subunit C [Pseudoflavonifractor sp.]|nr:alkyl hydroperoxide reductase subunit C [Alloprevotella sp.]MCM1116926.1 alkyl hydroperoxide reductase subunit C [Pseudoflavonifractor sp.]
MKTIINTSVPDFSVEAYVDGQFKNISLKDTLGKWAVYFFYPADFTFVCPTELEDMADAYKKLQGLGVEVYAISTDSQFSHKAWHDSSPAISKVKFPMLADKTGYLSEAFGVLDPVAFMAYRGTFVANPEGVIKIAEINDNGIGRSADDLTRRIEAAQFVAEHGDQVCPARWRPGDKTLTPGIDLVGKI